MTYIKSYQVWVEKTWICLLNIITRNRNLWIEDIYWINKPQINHATIMKETLREYKKFTTIIAKSVLGRIRDCLILNRETPLITECHPHFQSFRVYLELKVGKGPRWNSPKATLSTCHNWGYQDCNNKSLFIKIYSGMTGAESTLGWSRKTAPKTKRT